MPRTGYTTDNEDLGSTCLDKINVFCNCESGQMY